MECEDFPAFVSVFTQTVDSVRPSGNSNWVDSLRIFEIRDGEIIQRPRGILVYRVVVPGL